MSKPVLLIVDDDAYVRSSIKRFLRKDDLELLEAPSAEDAKLILETQQIAVLLADHKMEGMTGLELLRWARKNTPDTIRIMLTGHSSVSLMQEVINSGEVFRFLAKPWEHDQLRDVIENALQQHERIVLQKHIEEVHKKQEAALDQLEKRFDGALKELLETRQSLKESKIEAIQALAQTVDAKDPYTHGHSERVSDISRKIAETLKLPPDQVDAIEMAGLLHDIGKIGVPDSILLFNGKLDDAEWAIMKLHPEMGGKILDPIKFSWKLRELIEAHHERYDGRGYPFGLKGEGIPFGSRILAVADAYDAMAHARRYRSALSMETITNEIQKNLGAQFDPEIGKVFLDLLQSGEIQPGQLDVPYADQERNDA